MNGVAFQQGRTGGACGFFLTCEDFGRMFDNSFPARSFFVLFLYNWRLARAN